MTVPNDLDLPPGTQTELWYYDEAPDGSRPNQWAKYGTGTVSQDGSQIIPDIDPATGKQYGQPRFCCGINFAAIFDDLRRFLMGVWRSLLATLGGDPVDLATGLLVVNKTDLVLPGRLPVTLTRTYQTNGADTGPFGRGTTHTMQVMMLLQGEQRSIQFGDGRRATLTRQPDGTYRNLTDGLLQGAVLTAGANPTLQWKDGSTWTFGVTLNSAFGVSTVGLTQQRDRNNNTITNTWSGTRITGVKKGSDLELCVMTALDSLAWLDRCASNSLAPSIMSRRGAMRGRTSFSMTRIESSFSECSRGSSHGFISWCTPTV